jgi:hypothetical protein
MGVDEARDIEIGRLTGHDIVPRQALRRAMRDEIGEGFSVREDRPELDVREERSVCY